ncbi:MAG: M23 family metallopeptidase [Gemmatimonadales bacterium]|nr:MAG: M23 family metallopeptidase [Gemmatimonadales bacterium]
MSTRLPPAPSYRTAIMAGLVLGLISACGDPVTSPDETGPEPPPVALSHDEYSESQGIYRIPYIDGASLTVASDAHDHVPASQVDLVGVEVGGEIVAAASGTIRAIVDRHGNDGQAGDGLSADGSEAHDDGAEHGCVDDDTVIGSCADYNNYVWIEHPNGEWTRYTHFATGSVAANGWSAGDWVEAGQVLGTEGDVGAASGPGLQFEVGVPDDPDAAEPFQSLGGAMTPDFGENVLPLTCGLADLQYATGETHTAIPCAHQPPTADAGGPYEVDEGYVVPLDGSGSVDPEGLPLTFSWAPADLMDDPSLERPMFRGVDDGEIPVILTVYDQVEALSASAEASVNVLNVAPDVWIPEDQVTEIVEGQTLRVRASFGDPGLDDAPFTAVVQCHDVEGYDATVDGTVDFAAADGRLEGTVTAACPYGDTSQSGDPSEGTFTVTVTVTDKDGGEGSASFEVAVLNEAPSPSVRSRRATMVNGNPTFLLSVGGTLPLAARVTDPGSDDLMLLLDWADGETETGSYLLDPPNRDPFPSPDLSPRDITVRTSHRFSDACYYPVLLTVSDEDGGTGIALTHVVVTGTARRVQGAGYWMTLYRGNRGGSLDEATLGCYLRIAGHMSAVFDEERTGTDSFDSSSDVLWTNDSRGAMDQLLDRQLLTAWLNFANGALGWSERVDTNGDGAADALFWEAITAAEEVRLDPRATRQELEEQKDILERINGMDGD